MGKQEKKNRLANQRMKEIGVAKGITRCEVGFKGCAGDSFLSFAHLHKRNWYLDKDPNLLSDYSQFILACVPCHQILEKDAELTKDYFKILRGNNEITT